MAASGLGLGPWEVFHQGIARPNRARPRHREHPGRHPGPGPLVAPRRAAGDRDDPQRGHSSERRRTWRLPLLPRPDEPVAQLVMSVAGVAADRPRERALPRRRPGCRAARRAHDRAPPPLRVVDPTRPDGDRADRARDGLPHGRHGRPRHDRLRLRDRAGRAVHAAHLRSARAASRGAGARTSPRSWTRRARSASKPGRAGHRRAARRPPQGQPIRMSTSASTATARKRTVR